MGSIDSNSQNELTILVTGFGVSLSICSLLPRFLQLIFKALG